jgi:hypothetical protein
MYIFISYTLYGLKVFNLSSEETSRWGTKVEKKFNKKTRTAEKGRQERIESFFL